jgi:hypothetical protein
VVQVLKISVISGHEYSTCFDGIRVLQDVALAQLAGIRRQDYVISGFPERLRQMPRPDVFVEIQLHGGSGILSMR